jgi:hypothetical protein
MSPRVGPASVPGATPEDSADCTKCTKAAEATRRALAALEGCDLDEARWELKRAVDVLTTRGKGGG